MASTAVVSVSAVISDSTTSHEAQRMDIAGTIADVLGVNGQRQTLALSVGNNTITVPTGAVLFVASVISGTGGLTLCGNASDTGIAVKDNAVATTCPMICFPLGASPTIVLKCLTASLTLDVLWA